MPGYIVNAVWKNVHEKMKLSGLKNVMAKLSLPIEYRKGSWKADSLKARVGFHNNHSFKKLETIIWLNPYVKEMRLSVKKCNWK